MPRSSLQEIHETIKMMLSYALALSESPVQTVYEKKNIKLFFNTHSIANFFVHNLAFSLKSSMLLIY